MKKASIISSILLIAFQISNGQVAKKIVVEHFTNTKCSICASRNPGFYTNLNNQNGVIHLAIHPSAPYSGCVLSQHNASENDGRTNYYGIYGGTPRLVIQGVVIGSGANYSSSSIFASYLNQTTPASIKIYQYKYNNDSIRSTVVIKSEAIHSLSNLSLFVALAEETVNYTGSNGEPVHYDVFRKSLTGTSGVSITLPAAVGDSVVYTMSSLMNSTWDFSKIFTLAILQDATTKSVIQSENVSANKNNVVVSIKDESFKKLNANIFYFDKKINVLINESISSLAFELYDISGRKVLESRIESNSQQMNVSELSEGIYLYTLKAERGGIKTGKLIISY